MCFKNGKLIQRGTVEDYIRIFLIRENPAMLSPADAVPHGYRVLNGGATGFVIPHNPPQQAQIAGRYPVVVVQIQRQQRADIQAEKQLLIHMLRQQRRIQPMQSFHNDDGILI